MDKIFLDNMREYIDNYMARCEYPRDAVSVFLQLFDKISNDNECKKVFFAPIIKYAKGENIEFRKIVGENGITDQIATLTNSNKHTTSFLFSLCLLPFLQKRYEKADISPDIFYDSMLDLKYKLFECKKMYDVWGSFVTYWFDRWFDMTRFKLGRLEYELNKHCFVPTIIDGKNLLLKPYIMMHVPSSGTLSHDEVLESYKLAYDFYKDKFKDGKVPFVIGSWLLNPDHDKMLKESSNILKFSNDFKRVLVFPEPHNEDFWRIFYKQYSKNLDGIVPETSLQRAYLEHLKCHHIKMGIGAFLYTKDGIKK